MDLAILSGYFTIDAIRQLLGLCFWAGTFTSLAHCAPIPPDSHSGDRNGTFQILADGTQDLAALVALFATDSVERYVVDYPQGSISVAMASCSMLGLLGHVRALLKLGLGPEACENAAFSTIALRPIMGVARRDRIAASELRNIYYIRFKSSRDVAEWSLVKRVQHTDESLPWVSHLPYDRASRLELRHFWKDPTANRLGNLREPIYVLYHLFVQSLASAATAFTIAGFSQEASPTKHFATWGLFSAVVISSTMWAWYYGQESLAPDDPLEDGARRNLAFFYEDEGVAFYHANAVCGRLQKIIMFTSLLLSVIAAAAYVCQYIEVRKTTAAGAALWLVVQGCLALVRVFYWIAQPYLARSHRLNKYGSAYQSVYLCQNLLQEIEIIATWSSTFDDPRGDYTTTLRIPRSILNGLLRNSNDSVIGKMDLKNAFDLWAKAQDDPESPEVQQVLKGGNWWEMPPHTFHNWLDMRLRTMTGEGACEVGCQIIRYKDEFHLWPGLYYIYGSDFHFKWRAFIVQFKKEHPEKSLFALQETRENRWVHENGFNYPNEKGKGRIGLVESLIPDPKERDRFQQQQPIRRPDEHWSIVDKLDFDEFHTHFVKLL